MLTFVVALLVVISVLVFVHELGHYVAAKSVGIDVPRFSVGMGPRVFGFHAWGTEWVISAVPLGGYVKLAGMEDEPMEGGPPEDGASGEASAEPDEHSFDAKPIWARIWVISAGVVFNVIFAVLLYAGIFLFHGEPVDSDTRIAIVDRDALPVDAGALAEVPDGTELVAVGPYAVATWSEVDEALMAVPAGPVTLRFRDVEPQIIRLPRGQTDRIRLFSGNITPYTEPVVALVETGSPADRAGVRAGDRIVRIGDRDIAMWYEAVQIIRASPGEEIDLTVERDGVRETLSLVPDFETVIDERTRNVAIGRVGIGVDRPIEMRRFGPLGAVSRGAEQAWSETATVGRFVRDLVGGAESMRDLGGPIAIGQISADRMRRGLLDLLALMGFISINLAVLNLLPIPILDGGHLLFLAIEGIRGRPLSVEQRVRLSHVGLFLVGGLMLWVITNDLLRFFGI